MRGLKLLLFVLLLCAWATVRAHPLGNSTVNRWAQLSVSANSIEIDYVLDLAELPTQVESSTADRDGDGEVSSAEWAAYAKRWAQGLSRLLMVEVDGRPVLLPVREQRWKRKEGEAGLATLRIEARLHADQIATRSRVKTFYSAGRASTSASRPCRLASWAARFDARSITAHPPRS